MKKFQEALKNLALSDLPSANQADTLYRSSKDLNDDELSLWVLKNQDELKGVLQFPSVMEEASPWKREMMREFFDVRNAGVSASTGDRRDVMGNPLRTVDDYMKAFGYMRDDGGEITDDDRSAFTNPDSPKYWGNIPENEREHAAVALGRESFDEIEGDLRRAGEDYQRRNQMEGYGADNSLDVPMWLASSIAGLGAPRIKEAMLDGRPVGWQDIVGDMAELGLNFVPGVGIADKAGNVVLKSSRISSDFLKDAGSKLAFGAGFGLESVAQPLLTQAMDVGLLYNPETMGTATSGLNMRSQWSGDKLASQTLGIGAGKGVLKGYGARVKNSLEQSVGDEAGGQMYKGGFKESIGNIGSKTDDMIAKRQIALDRKAELAARNASNVEGVGNPSYRKSGTNPEDILEAENYRVLSEEAKRRADMQKLADRYADDPEKYWEEYRKIYNDKDLGQLVQLDDGRLVRGNNMGIDGHIYVDGVEFPNDWKQVVTKYADRNNRLVDDVEMGELIDELDRNGSFDNTKKYWFKPETQNYLKNMGLEYDRANNRIVYKGYDNADNFVDRNLAVDEGMKKYPELMRRAAGSTFGKEWVRDAGANAVYNMLAREGYANVGGMVGSMKDVDEKRQKALWNNMLNKLRDFTANPRFSPEDRKKYYEATMNVMFRGLDGISEDEFRRYPQVYRNIARKLGVDNWKHPSEFGKEPDASSSTYTPTSSSSSK